MRLANQRINCAVQCIVAVSMSVQMIGQFNQRSLLVMKQFLSEQNVVSLQNTTNSSPVRNKYISIKGNGDVGWLAESLLIGVLASRFEFLSECEQRLGAALFKLKHLMHSDICEPVVSFMVDGQAVGEVEPVVKTFSFLINIFQFKLSENFNDSRKYAVLVLTDDQNTCQLKH